MKIAVVGAGFSGIATAWFLLQNPHVSITLLDDKGIGGGASGIAAGLLHPYVGAHAKRNWMASEGMQATLALLNIASQTLQKPVYEATGMIRTAQTEEQKIDFRLCADKYHDVKWFEAAECKELSPHIVPCAGIFIHEALAVHAALYLQGLWMSCEALGGRLQTQRVHSLQELQGFDAIVLTVGADIGFFAECQNTRISRVKGQILELAWPKTIPPLTYPVNSQAYILMGLDRSIGIAGSTFERDFQTREPDLPIAKELILGKLTPILPCLKEAQILACKAGVRASTPDKRPLIAEPVRNTWLLTGMGSRGLLYHAVYAKKLADIILGRFFAEAHGTQLQS